MPVKKKAKSKRSRVVTEYVQAPQVVQQSGQSAEGDFKVDNRAAGMPQHPSVLPNTAILEFLNTMGHAEKNRANLAKTGLDEVLDEVTQPLMMGLEAYKRDPSVKYRLGTDTTGAILALGQRAQAKMAEKYMDELLDSTVKTYAAKQAQSFGGGIGKALKQASSSSSKP